MINEPIKITDLHSLKREKQRLQIYSSYQEEMIHEKFIYLKQNYTQVVADEFLPYSSEKNKSVNSILEFANEYVFEKLLGLDFSGKNKLGGILIKLSEVVILRLFNRFKKK